MRFYESGRPIKTLYGLRNFFRGFIGDWKGGWVVLVFVCYKIYGKKFWCLRLFWCKDVWIERKILKKKKLQKLFGPKYNLSLWSSIGNSNQEQTSSKLACMACTQETLILDAD